MQVIVCSQDVGVKVGKNVGINGKETEEKVLLLLQQDSRLTSKVLASTLGISQRQAERILKKLKETKGGNAEMCELVEEYAEKKAKRREMQVKLELAKNLIENTDLSLEDIAKNVKLHCKKCKTSTCYRRRACTRKNSVNIM